MVGYSGVDRKIREFIFTEVCFLPLDWRYNGFSCRQPDPSDASLPCQIDVGQINVGECFDVTWEPLC